MNQTQVCRNVINKQEEKLILIFQIMALSWFINLLFNVPLEQVTKNDT